MKTSEAPISRTSAICSASNNSPRNSKKALSRPIREERPPARMTALKLITFGNSFLAVSHQGLDLIGLDRHIGHKVKLPAFGDDNGIFEADAEALLFNVYRRFHREHPAGFD